jgi:hypothetical protein
LRYILVVYVPESEFPEGKPVDAVLRMYMHVQARPQTQQPAEDIPNSIGFFTPPFAKNQGDGRVRLEYKIQFLRNSYGFANARFSLCIDDGASGSRLYTSPAFISKARKTDPTPRYHEHGAVPNASASASTNGGGDEDEDSSESPAAAAPKKRQAATRGQKRKASTTESAADDASVSSDSDSSQK